MEIIKHDKKYTTRPFRLSEWARLSIKSTFRPLPHLNNNHSHLMIQLEQQMRSERDNNQLYYCISHFNSTKNY